MAKKSKTKPDTKSPTICLNKRARFDYELIEKHECGVVLTGSEVKSIRAGHAQITESYAVFNKDGELMLLNANILPYSHGGYANHEERRSRKLLMHKHQLTKLAQKKDQQGLTLIPTAMYWSKGKVKVEIALGRGKKTHDKRATVKERDWNRQKHRLLKN